MIIGLDISTSFIGYTVLDQDRNIIQASYIDLKKHKDFYEKLDCFGCFVASSKCFDPQKSHFFVEEPLLAFSRGGSMAQTLAKLQSFNAMCRTFLYMQYGKKPTLLNVAAARKKAGIKIKRIKRN